MTRLTWIHFKITLSRKRIFLSNAIMIRYAEGLSSFRNVCQYADLKSFFSTAAHTKTSSGKKNLVKILSHIVELLTTTKAVKYFSLIPETAAECRDMFNLKIASVLTIAHSDRRRLSGRNQKNRIGINLEFTFLMLHFLLAFLFFSHFFCRPPHSRIHALARFIKFIRWELLPFSLFTLTKLIISFENFTKLLV